MTHRTIRLETPTTDKTWREPASVADETDKLNAIMAAAGGVSNAGGAGVGAAIRLGAGSFYASGLVLPPNVSLFGSGIGATYLRANADGTLIEATGWNKIQDVYLRGDNRDADLLDITGARVTVRDIWMQATTGNGITIDHTLSSIGATEAIANRLSGIQARTISGSGIIVNDTDTLISDIDLGTCNVGVEIKQGATIISGFHVWGCTSHGITVIDATRANSFTNGYMETNGGRGIYISNTRATRMSNVNFWSNDAGGLYATGSDSTVMTGCEMRDNTGPGAQFVDHSYAVITGCIAYDFQATKTQTYAVQSTGTSNLFAVSGNGFRNSEHSSGTAISLAGANNIVTGNVT